jgi:hypothetical protein
MKIELIREQPKEQTTDKIIALSRVLEIVTDPSRVLPSAANRLADVTMEKLLNLINGVSTATTQEGNH